MANTSSELTESATNSEMHWGLNISVACGLFLLLWLSLILKLKWVPGCLFYCSIITEANSLLEINKLISTYSHCNHRTPSPLTNHHHKAEPRSAVMCVCVCWDVKGSLLWACSSSVCTREWERDPDVKLESERGRGMDGGIRAGVIRESGSASQQWFALTHTHTHTSMHLFSHTAAYKDLLRCIECKVCLTEPHIHNV